MEMMSAYGGESSEIPSVGSSGISVTPTLSWLPDSVLLEVLSFLSVRDLIRSCRTAKTKAGDGQAGCYNVVWAAGSSSACLQQGSMKKNTRPGISYYDEDVLNSKILWHLVRHWLGTSMQTLKIKGFLLSAKKQEFLTPAILQVLEKRFPSLENLHLEETSLRSLSYDYLPSTLKTLELSQCEIPTTWFKSLANKIKTLPKLETLVLSNVSSFSNHHLEAICSQSALKTLYLAGTYRVTDIGIQKAVPYLKGLEHFKLNGCNVTDITLHLIGCHLKHLRTLALTNFCSLTDAGLACLSGIKTLEKLWLEYCFRLSSNCIIAVCVNMAALNYLNLNGIFFEDQGIDEIRKSLPHCAVTNSFPNMDSKC
ncbi:PREDICTED: F-box/LRR-repeat protein 12 [Nanorana parkeri]|uniref:F-box/LRR-repeat protein 12 n=1 Tax=Nanorana parkeri TaxID=125878 RepID=UPI000854A99D|nr:PREDICTED: F-box/LRR-repeat protein 12 [Nanorana parkeri]